MQPEITTRHLGIAIRKIRERKGFLQALISYKLGHKFPRYLSSLENGNKCPNFETLEKLAQALECPLWRILWLAEKIALKEQKDVKEFEDAS